MNNNGLIDISNQRFGTLVAKEYVGNKKWKCICDCGNIRVTEGRDLRRGTVKKCSAFCLSSPKSIVGIRYGKLTVKEYVGDSRWKCVCDCGNTTVVIKDNLVNGRSKSCGCSKKNPDFIGMKVGHLTVKERCFNHIKNKFKNTYVCECDCGNKRTVKASDLKKGVVNDCGAYHQRSEIIGKRFNNLVVKSLVDNTKAICICDCGNEREVRVSELLSREIKHCGCFIGDDLTNRRIGRLTVKGFSGNALWLCICDCGNEVKFRGAYLRRNLHKTCGKNCPLGSFSSKDLMGMKFGRLTVTEKVVEERTTKEKGQKWRCRCDCGRDVIVRAQKLKQGKRMSCGCSSSKYVKNTYESITGEKVTSGNSVILLDNNKENLTIENMKVINHRTYNKLQKYGWLNVDKELKTIAISAIELENMCLDIEEKL